MRGGLRHKWSLLRGQWLAHASAASGHWVARPSGRGIADVSPAAMQSARDGLQQDGGASRSSQPGRAESASSGGNTDEVRTHPSGRSVTASLLAAAGSSNPAGPCLPCLPELQHSHGPLLYVTGIQDRQLALPSACRGAEQAHGVNPQHKPNQPSQPSMWSVVHQRRAPGIAQAARPGLPSPPPPTSTHRCGTPHTAASRRPRQQPLGAAQTWAPPQSAGSRGATQRWCPLPCPPAWVGVLVAGGAR